MGLTSSSSSSRRTVSPSLPSITSYGSTSSSSSSSFSSGVSSSEFDFLLKEAVGEVKKVFQSRMQKFDGTNIKTLEIFFFFLSFHRILLLIFLFVDWYRDVDVKIPSVFNNILQLNFYSLHPLSSFT